MRLISKMLVICSVLIFSTGAFATPSHDLLRARLEKMIMKVDARANAKLAAIDGRYGSHPDAAAREQKLIDLVELSRTRMLDRLQMQLDGLPSPT
ncbi:MAG: hypothetical protein ACKE51_02245 [Methylococcaceae bacterium]